MGRAKKVRKTVKRLRQSDARLKVSPKAEILARQKPKDPQKPQKLKTPDGETVVDIEHVSSSLFLDYNTKLGPPYRILMDTNFVNFSIQNKVDIFKGMMDCLMAKCIPYVTDCVIGELEKMGHRYRLALRIAKDPRICRLTCTHKGTYADDCLLKRVVDHRCYIVATSDRELKRRIRKVPGVPIMFVTKHKFAIERLPDAVSAVPFSNARLKSSLGV